MEPHAPSGVNQVILGSVSDLLSIGVQAAKRETSGRSRVWPYSVCYGVCRMQGIGEDLSMALLLVTLFVKHLSSRSLVPFL